MELTSSPKALEDTAASVVSPAAAAGLETSMFFTSGGSARSRRAVVFM